MRIPLSRLIFLLGVLFVSSPAFAQGPPPEAFHVELGLNWWKPEPQITIASGNLSSNIDFVQDLGITEDRFREIRATIKPGRKHKIRFAYVPVRYVEEGKVLARTVVFRGKTYNVNLPVNTVLNWDFYRFGYEYDFVAARHGFVGLFADLKYNKLDAQISSPIGDEQTIKDVAVPTIGGIGRAYLGDYVSVTGEFTLFKFNKSTFDGKFYDFDLSGQVNINRNVAGQLGYRRVKVNYLVDEDLGDLKLEGIYFGGVIRF